VEQRQGALRISQQSNIALLNSESVMKRYISLLALLIIAGASAVGAQERFHEEEPSFGPDDA
jgi:hypothetical protein